MQRVPVEHEFAACRLELLFPIDEQIEAGVVDVERFFAITMRRKVDHPAITTILQSARDWLI